MRRLFDRSASLTEPSYSSGSKQQEFGTLFRKLFRQLGHSYRPLPRQVPGSREQAPTPAFRSVGRFGRLIEDYEAEHDPLPTMSPVEALRYLLDENGLTQAELCAQTSLPVATISEVLNGKRGISPRVRQGLAERFKVSPALFV